MYRRKGKSDLEWMLSGSCVGQSPLVHARGHLCTFSLTWSCTFPLPFRCSHPVPGCCHQHSTPRPWNIDPCTLLGFRCEDTRSCLGTRIAANAGMARLWASPFPASCALSTETWHMGQFLACESCILSICTDGVLFWNTLSSHHWEACLNPCHCLTWLQKPRVHSVSGRGYSLAWKPPESPISWKNNFPHHP